MPIIITRSVRVKLKSDGCIKKKRKKKNIVEDFYNLQLQFYLSDLLSSQVDCFRVNSFFFKTLMNLARQSD